MKRNSRRLMRLAAVLSAWMLVATLGGCAGSAVREAPPHIVASLSDNQYFWFLYLDDAPPELEIWRVNSDSPAFERFDAPMPEENSFRAWQVDGGWIWYLTDTGLWRVGRFPPDTGKIERFEPDLINVEAIGNHSVVLVQNARIIVGGELGLFLFDRQGRQLTKISSQRVAKLKDSPFGVLVFTERAFFLLDTTLPDPALKKLTLKSVKSWQDIPQGSYVAADPDRLAVVAMADPSTMSFIELEQLQLELDPREYLTEAFSYGGRLWLLTNAPRLIVLEPATGEMDEYSLYHVEGIMSDFVVQDGRLRCGPIVGEGHGSDVLVAAVRFWPGDVKPLLPVRYSITAAGVKFSDQEAVEVPYQPQSDAIVPEPEGGTPEPQVIPPEPDLTAPKPESAPPPTEAPALEPEISEPATESGE